MSDEGSQPEKRPTPKKKTARRPRRKRQGSLVPIAEAMRGAYPGKKRFDEARVFGAWNDSVPERVTRVAQPFRLERRVLMVRVKNNVWAQELTFLRPEILRQLSVAAPETPVNDIRFIVGKLPEVARIPHLERREDLPPPHPAPLNAEMEAELAQITDPELRAAMRRAAELGLGRLEEKEATEAAKREADALRARATEIERQSGRRRK